MDALTKAFLEWANRKGYDTAHAYNQNESRWMFLSPMTADVYEAWQAARTVPEASSAIFASRCPMCSYQHGHQIGCENNPIDIALRAAAYAVGTLQAMDSGLTQS